MPSVANIYHITTLFDCIVLIDDHLVLLLCIYLGTMVGSHNQTRYNNT